MLEIIGLVFLCRYHARLASDRGHNGAIYGFFTGAMWIGLELLGIVVGYMIGFSFVSYFLGLAGAGIGALVSWLVACNLNDRIEASAEIGRGPLLPQVMPVQTLRGMPDKPKDPVWCLKCGKQLDPGSLFCDRCGEKVATLD